MQLISCPTCGQSSPSGTPACERCGAVLASVVTVPPTPWTPPSPSTAAAAPPAPPIRDAPAGPATDTGGGPPPAWPAPVWGQPTPTAQYRPPDAAATPSFGTNGTSDARREGWTPTAPRTRRRTGLVAAVLVVLVAGGVAAFLALRPAATSLFDEEWRQVTPPAARVTFELPGEPDVTTATIGSNGVSLSGSTVSIGGGGLERAAVGAVYVEGDLGQVGVTAESVGALRDALVRAAASSGLEQIGASPPTDMTPATALDGGIRFRSTAPDDLALEGAVVTSGTQLVGVLVTVPAGEEARAAEVLDRITMSLKPQGDR